MNVQQLEKGKDTANVKTSNDLILLVLPLRLVPVLLLRLTQTILLMCVLIRAKTSTRTYKTGDQVMPVLV